MKLCSAMLVLVAAVMSSDLWAQTIYRCKDAHGSTIYSQMPCTSDGKGQEEIELKNEKSAERTPEESARVEDLQRRGAMVSIASREAACIRNGIDNVWRPVNARIRQHEGQISQLEADTRRARNNLAGATWEAGLREQISGLHQMIALERQTASSQEIEVRRRCAEQRKAEEEALVDSTPTP